MILLAAINSKFIHSNPAVYYLKAYAEKYKDEIHIEEYTINQNIEEIIADIFEKSPDVLAFSCYIWNRCTVERILREIPKILPECRVILGGPEAGNDADSFLKDFDCVDAVIIGEGEKTFCELCGYYVEGRGDLRDIRGLKLRRQGNCFPWMTFRFFTASGKMKKAWDPLTIRLFIMRRAADVRSDAATVCLRSTAP